MPLVIGVTGHRDLLPAEVPMLELAVQAFLADLQARYRDLPLQLITPLAEGADRLVARVARDMNLPITILLPMPEHFYRADFQGESRQIFDEMLEFGEVVELPLLPGVDAACVVGSGSERDAQYAYLGVYLAAHSHILLALWDGKNSGAAGGTANVVQFHQQHIVEPSSGEGRRSPIDFSEDESDLVYHIACSRVESGSPAAGLAPGDCSWLTRDDLEPRTDELPERYRLVFAGQEAFNRDLANSGHMPMGDCLADLSAEPNRHLLQPLHDLYQRVDALATRYQRLALRTLKLMFASIALTGISFILYADFSGLDFAIYLYLLFITVTTGFYVLEKRGSWYRKYIDYRGLAEGLRIQFYFGLAGVEQIERSYFTHDGFMKRQDLELGWIRNVMRYAGHRVDSTTGLASSEGLEQAIGRWLGDQHSGQLGYYLQRVDDRRRRASITRRLSFASFAAGLLLAFALALSLALSLELTSATQSVFVALMGALPFIAAVRQSYAHRVSEQELIAQYNHMARLYANAFRLLANCGNPAEKREILRALGEASLEESGFWILRQRERPIAGHHALQSG